MIILVVVRLLFILLTLGVLVEMLMFITVRLESFNCFLWIYICLLILSTAIRIVVPEYLQC